jgi:hypothetical protein
MVGLSHAYLGGRVFSIVPSGNGHSRFRFLFGADWYAASARQAKSSICASVILFHALPNPKRAGIRNAQCRVGKPNPIFLIHSVNDHYRNRLAVSTIDSAAACV